MIRSRKSVFTARLKSLLQYAHGWPRSYDRLTATCWRETMVMGRVIAHTCKNYYILNGTSFHNNILFLYSHNGE